MAVLTTKRRNALSKTQFALPAKEAYPIPDARHAANAKARATQMNNAGKLSDSAKKQIDAKANKMLAKSKKK